MRCCLYRAIDWEENQPDSLLGKRRDTEAAKCFDLYKLSRWFASSPEGTIDGHNSSPRTIREILRSNVLHRTLNNQREQNHRGSSRDLLLCACSEALPPRHAFAGPFTLQRLAYFLRYLPSSSVSISSNAFSLTLSSFTTS